MYAIREKPYEGINGALYVVRGMVNTIDSVSKLVDSGMLLIEQIMVLSFTWKGLRY